MVLPEPNTAVHILMDAERFLYSPKPILFAEYAKTAE